MGTAVESGPSAGSQIPAPQTECFEPKSRCHCSTPSDGGRRTLEVVNPNWRECNKQVKNINAKYNRTMAQWHKHRNDAGSANHAAKVELLAQQLAESKRQRTQHPPTTHCRRTTRTPEVGCDADRTASTAGYHPHDRPVVLILSNSF